MLINRKITKDTCRTCRCGAGTEKTPGKGDTPGFELREEDEIDEEQFKGMRILKLKRNENRMKQTSTTMLQSWRANCDVSVLIYKNEKTYSITCQDIANVVQYVVSYCTKGNMSYHMEREAIATIIMAAEDDFVEGVGISTVTLVRKILNSFHSKRVISKAEASCDLLDLPLFKCTERIVRVSLSSHTKIRKMGKNSSYKSKSHLESYARRLESYKDMCFHEYFYSHLSNPHNTQNEEKILVCTGLGGTPSYPPTYGYAKASLIVYKPWSVNRRLRFEEQGSDNQSIIEEFKEFVKSDDCPVPLKLSYHMAFERHKRNIARQDCTNRFDPETSEDGVDENATNLIEACRIFRSDKLLSSMDRGLNYDWSKLIHSRIDPELDGKNWLMETKQKYLEFQKNKKYIPTKNDGTTYSLDDVNNDLTQSQLVYAVIKKVKEWVEWPDKTKVSFHYHLNISLLSKSVT